MTTRSAKAIRAAGLLALLLSIYPASFAGNLAELTKRAAEFKLANGMRIVVLERHSAPLISFHLRAGAGTADEAPGKSGTALLLERMFYHGSESIGSRNPAQEKTVLQTIEKLMDTVSAEFARGDKANPLLTQDTEIQARIAISNASTLGHRSVFREALEASGAVAARIVPNAASTDFTATLPAHRAEAWPRLVGEWLRRPSWRFFYEERSALSARLAEPDPRPRMRVRQELLRSAFPSHPYSKLHADPGEALRVRPRDLEDFMASRWAPSNLVLAIVGDITLGEAKRMAETHFGKLAAGQMPKPALTQPLSLEKEKRSSVEMQAAPVLALAWYRPDASHPDDPVFDVLTALFETRKGPFFDKLKDQILTMRATTALPTDRSQALFSLEVFLPPHQTFPAVEKHVDEFLEQLAATPVSAAEADYAKLSLRAGLLSFAEGHAEMAGFLARWTAERGSPSAAGAALDRIAAVTPADIQRVARQYLRKQSRFTLQAGLPGMVAEDAE